MKRTISFTILAFLAGAALSAVFLRTLKPASEEPGSLTESQVREWTRQIPLQVTANLIGTSDRVIPTDESGDQVVKFADGLTEVALVYVKARLSYTIDVEVLSEPLLKLDTQRRVATINLPSPRLVDVAEHPEKIAFVSADNSQEPTRITAEVMSSLQRLAERGRYLEDAKALCTDRLSSAVSATGYTTKIVWSEAGLPSGGKRPL
jgi:hypothetical protein